MYQISEPIRRKFFDANDTSDAIDNVKFHVL